MLDLLFWTVFLIFPFFVILQLKAVGERINQISLVNITTVSLYLFSVVGIFPLFYFLDDYRYETGIRDRELILTVLFYSLLNIVFFLFGVIFVRKIMGLKPVKFFSKDISGITNLQKVVLACLFLFCVTILILYLMQIDRVAIIVALTEGVGAAEMARSKMGNDFSGKYHWYKLVMHDIGNFLTFVTFGSWLIRKNKSTLFAFIVTLSYSVFTAIMATEKSPLAMLMISLFMVFYLIKNDGIIPFKKLVTFTVFIIGILVLTYIFFMGSGTIDRSIESVFSRAFSGSISPVYFYLEFIPKHQEFLWGRTFPNPGGFMPFEPYPLTIKVMNWKFPEHLTNGVVGSMPTVFWGESYANFGPVGIPIIAFLMGSVIAFLSYLVSKLEINLVSLAFMVWLIQIFKDISASGFSGYFLNLYIVSIAFLTFLILFIRGRFKIRTSHNVKIYE